MELFNTYENRTIYNAFGVIPGHIEPGIVKQIPMN